MDPWGHCSSGTLLSPVQVWGPCKPATHETVNNISLETAKQCIDQIDFQLLFLRLEIMVESFFNNFIRYVILINGNPGYIYRLLDICLYLSKALNNGADTVKWIGPSSHKKTWSMRIHSLCTSVVQILWVPKKTTQSLFYTLYPCVGRIFQYIS